MKKEMMPIMVVMLILIIVALVFAVQGISMHSQVAVEEAEFHALQADYFANSKAIRDGADSGSALTAQLVEIQNTPSELLRLKLVGVGKILTGIFVVLLGILLALILMPTRLGQILYKHMGSK